MKVELRLKALMPLDCTVDNNAIFCGNCPLLLTVGAVHGVAHVTVTCVIGHATACHPAISEPPAHGSPGGEFVHKDRYFLVLKFLGPDINDVETLRRQTDLLQSLLMVHVLYFESDYKPKVTHFPWHAYCHVCIHRHTNTHIKYTLEPPQTHTHEKHLDHRAITVQYPALALSSVFADIAYTAIAPACTLCLVPIRRVLLFALIPADARIVCRASVQSKLSTGDDTLGPRQAERCTGHAAHQRLL